MIEFDHTIDTSLPRSESVLKDELERRPVAELLARRALDRNPSASRASLDGLADAADRGTVLGIYGTWGSGKSFVLDLTIEELFRQVETLRPIVCQFQPWRYEPDTSLAPGLILALNSVREQFPQRNPEFAPAALEDVRRAAVRVSVLIRRAVGWLNTAAGIAVAGASAIPTGSFKGQEAAETTAKVIQAITAVPTSAEPPTAIPSDDIRNWDPGRIRSEMSALIGDLRKAAAVAEGRAQEDYRVIVVIDDLDRCAPDLMVDMLNWLKVHLSVSGCSYLLALDHEAAARAVVGRYKSYLGDKADVAYGLRYLEKIVDFEVQLGLSDRVERMAARSVTEDWSRQAETAVDIVDVTLGRQGVRSADMGRLTRLPTLQSPRTMLKVMYRFRLALNEVERIERVRLRSGAITRQLPGDYAFWLLLLVAMYYRLAPADIESFCEGHGPILQKIDEGGRESEAPSPVTEFRDFLNPVLSAAAEGRMMPSISALSELYSVVRQLAVP